MTSVGPRYLSAALSDQGLVRGNNEDRVYTDDGRGIFLVVDGMGGHEAGEQAADMAVSTIKARLERQTGAMEQRIREAITLANNAIYEAAQSKLEWRGMACVLTLAVIEDGQVTIGHVGDSRLYAIRRGNLDKITHDHSPVGEREDSGELSEAVAMKHPRRNEVYRDVGSEERTPDEEDFIEIRRIPFAPDSALLLCSDGLSDALSSKQILELIQQNAGDRWAAVRSLIAAATKVGKDNVSAVFIEGNAFSASSRTVRGRWYGGRIAFFVLGGLASAAVAFFAAQYFALSNQIPVGQQFTVAPPGAISAALQKAQAGDTILVAPGTYNESVRLKNGVNVIAREAHHAIVRGPVTADDIESARFEGFQVEGEKAGIRINNSDVVLARDDISGVAGPGIELDGNSRGAIFACDVHDNRGPGILLNGTASPAVERNTITHNGTGSDTPMPGLLVRSSLQAVVTGNLFANNGAEAVWLPAEEPSILSKNHFADPADGSKKPKIRIIGVRENQP